MGDGKEGGEMTEWKIPQEMLDQSEEIKRLHAVISRLHAERRINAIDGQCALDEANNRVAELEVENKRLKELLEPETFYLKAAQREIARLKQEGV